MRLPASLLAWRGQRQKSEGKPLRLGWRPHSGPSAWHCLWLPPSSEPEGPPCQWPSGWHGSRCGLRATAHRSILPKRTRGQLGGGQWHQTAQVRRWALRGSWVGAAMGTAPLTSHCRQHRPPPSAPWPDAPMLQRAPVSQVGPALGSWGHQDPAHTVPGSEGGCAMGTASRS